MRTSNLAAAAPFVGAVLLVGALAIAVTVPVVAQDACTDGIAQVEQAMTTAAVPESNMATVKSLLEESRASRDSGDMRACTDAVAQARTILDIG